MGGQQGITSHFWLHRAVTQDEMRQDGEDRFARGALDTPDGEPTQPDPDIMRVAGETPTPATGRRVGELQAQGEDKGEDELDKRLAIGQQAKVGRFILKINGNGAVVPRRCRCCAQCITPRSSRLVSGRDTMGVTHCNSKTIVKESGRYHKIHWNVDASCVTSCTICYGVELHGRDLLRFILNGLMRATNDEA